MNVLTDLSGLLSEANNYVLLNDRSLYDPFFVVFEEYCSTNNVTYTLLSASYAILRTVDETVKLKHDSYMITVSVDNPKKMAQAVTALMVNIKSRHVDPKTVSYTGADDEFTININTRQCFKINQSPRFRDTTVDALVGTMPGIGLWTGLPVKCQNVYSLVAYLLSQSYDPRSNMDIGLVTRLIDILKPIIKTGSKDKGRRKENNGKRILDHVTGRKGIYIIEPATAGSMPTFTLDAPFDTLRKELEEKFTIRVMKYNLHDLDDFALAKYVIHDSDDRAVCAIFNSMEHQVIPILPGHRVSRRYRARVKLLEIQMLKMMAHIGKNMDNVISGVLATTLSMFNDPKFFDEDDIVGHAGTCIAWNVLKRITSKRSFGQTVYAAAASTVAENNEVKNIEGSNDLSIDLLIGDEPFGNEE